MKHFITTFLLLTSLSLAGTFSISIRNPIDQRRNEVIEIPMKSLLEKYPDFNFNYFSIRNNGEEIPYEIINGFSADEKVLTFYIELPGNELHKLIFDDSEAGLDEKKTQAYLGIKKDYQLKDGYYTEGRFESTAESIVPNDHFPHNALYQYEGPGWESELIGYRLYLDVRNRIDIFGKKTNELIVNQIGKNDLVSDGKESYQKMHDWGLDIFKVANTLGIGSPAHFTDSVVTISKTDSIFCRIYDNDLLSAVETNHLGWMIGDNKINIKSLYSMAAGSRLTKAELFFTENLSNITTGLAKHDGTKYFKGENSYWGYIALWGMQTLSNDNLGISIIYKKSDLIELKEDDINYLVLLKPQDKKSRYYFAAAWEQEMNGIKTLNEFQNYLNEEIKKLANPIEVILE